MFNRGQPNQGELYFNLEGGIGQSCVLLHNEDDALYGNYQYATDGGNDVSSVAVNDQAGLR